MKHLFCLASLGVCLAFAGCAEPTTDTVDAPIEGTDEAVTLDYFADADFAATLKANPVTVVNFTADW